MVGYLVNNEFAKMWKEAIKAYFEVLFQNLPRGDEETHETPQSGYSWCPGPTFEPGNPPLQVRNFTA
jgi:hypothetical protein